MVAVERNRIATTENTNLQVQKSSDLIFSQLQHQKCIHQLAPVGRTTPHSSMTFQ